MNLEDIGSTLDEWLERPAQMVEDLFGVEPDAWQAEALAAFPHSPRMAFKASKGVGKTACEAWLIWNFLLTRPYPKIACTAIDSNNLSDNLWTELALWRSKSQLLQATFEWTKTRIFAKQYPETWWASARTWSKTADRNQQSNTLAGLHAEYIMFVLDESGGMPDAIMASAEAALSSCKEGHIIQAGNPTHLEGPLYAACTKERRLWKVIEINGDPDNPKRASRVSIEWAREQIEKYGRNNPWVLVNVFGQFPPASINALIGPDEVKEAMQRYYRTHEIGNAAKVLGVDVARFGDDASVICQRQGIQVFPFKKYRNVDSTQGAGAVSRIWKDWDAHSCFVDDTGGFGSGWIDRLITLGRSPVGIHFAGKPHNPHRFVNKRAEMYFDAVEWIKRKGALPDDCHELLAALTQTTYTFQGDKILLEPKDDIKVKLGYSPDEADSFVLTFAEPVTVPDVLPRSQRTAALEDYNPYKEPATASDLIPRDQRTAALADYHPYRESAGSGSDYDPFR
jgi:phage terminase large subunit